MHSVLPSTSVRHGRDRSPTAYVWPQKLVRPPEDMYVVYLDLNHWIALAKANTGHPDGVRHQLALQAIRRSGSRFVFPLSSVHYMEMAAIRDPRQRLDVATVMEEISGFSCLMANSVVMRLEIEALVARYAGRPEQLEAIPFLGRGVLQAFGRRGGLMVRSTDGDVTDATRASWPGGPDAFDAWREEAERRLDRAVLRGPTDAEAPALRAAGWDPTAARRIASDMARQEREQAQRLTAEPRWRRGRLRDVVAARYLAFDALPMLQETLTRYNLHLEEMAGGDIADARRFTDSMPSADVHISLLTAAHSNPQTQWTPNDIFDMDALSVAVAYCDVVVTERHATHLLHAGRVADRLGTQVFGALDQLVDLLDA